MMAKVRRRRTWGVRSDIGQNYRCGPDGTLFRMPELPDVTVYVESLAAKVQGGTLQRVRLLNPFVLRTAVPLIGEAEGRTVEGIERLGKRIVVALSGGLFLVIHLMIAGRLKWLAAGAKPPGGKAT